MRHSIGFGPRQRAMQRPVQHAVGEDQRNVAGHQRDEGGGARPALRRAQAAAARAAPPPPPAPARPAPAPHQHRGAEDGAAGSRGARRITSSLRARPRRRSKHRVDQQFEQRDVQRREEGGAPSSSGSSASPAMGTCTAEHEAHRLAQVVVDAAALAHRAHQRAEVVVEQHQRGGFARATSVPRAPIATPMRPSAGASLTPSPVIATTSPRATSDVTSSSLRSGVTRVRTASPSMPAWAAMARAVTGGRRSASARGCRPRGIPAPPRARRRAAGRPAPPGPATEGELGRVGGPGLVLEAGPRHGEHARHARPWSRHALRGGALFVAELGTARPRLPARPCGHAAGVLAGQLPDMRHRHALG